MKQGGTIPPPKTAAWELCPSCKTMGNIKPNAKKSQSSFGTIFSIFSNLFVFACMHNHSCSKSELQWFLCSINPTAHYLGKWWSFHLSPTCRGVWTSWLLPERVQIFVLSESKRALYLFFWEPDCDREWKLVVLLFRMILFQASQKAMPTTNPCVALFSSGNVWSQWTFPQLN